MHVEQEFTLDHSAGQTVQAKLQATALSQHCVQYAAVCQFCWSAGFKEICDLGWNEWKTPDQCIYTALIHCSTCAVGLGVGSIFVQNWEPCSFVCCVLKPCPQRELALASRSKMPLAVSRGPAWVGAREGRSLCSSTACGRLRLPALQKKEGMGVARHPAHLCALPCLANVVLMFGVKMPASSPAWCSLTIASKGLFRKWNFAPSSSSQSATESLCGWRLCLPARSGVPDPPVAGWGGASGDDSGLGDFHAKPPSCPSLLSACVSRPCRAAEICRWRFQ